MLMPFGTHKGKEVEKLPCKYLRWIQRNVSVEPPPNVKPENREQFKRTRTQLKYEVNRVLRERAANRVSVDDDGKFHSGRGRRRG